MSSEPADAPGRVAQLSTVLHALARLRPKSPAFAAAASATAAKPWPSRQRNGRVLASVAWAYGNSGYREATAMRALQREVGRPPCATSEGE
jgi:hypothetical protein